MPSNEPTSRATPSGADETHLVVLTGMSGGGKTVALRTLEDLEFFCVDNLPSALLPQLVGAVVQGGAEAHRRIAVGMDVRTRGTDLANMPNVLSDLAASGVKLHLIFIDCNDAILIKRFSETRRRHPLATHGLSLGDAIAVERKLLRPLMAIADTVIDSSDLNVHQLRRLIATGYAQATEGLTLMIQSFAFRRGLPLDSDFVFDARCLPNPHWQAALRPLSGKDSAVREYLEGEPLVQEFFDDTLGWLDAWLPRFEADDRSYLTVAIGCTGGRHRSVYLVEKLAAHYRGQREGVLTFHRELE
jgi:UPF0042 nucleotide-binding protein